MIHQWRQSIRQPTATTAKGYQVREHDLLYSVGGCLGLTRHVQRHLALFFCFLAPKSPVRPSKQHYLVRGLGHPDGVLRTLYSVPAPRLS
jgi:hypothetical protein